MAKIIDITGALGEKEFATTKTQLAELPRAIGEEMEVESEAMATATNPTEFCEVVRRTH